SAEFEFNASVATTLAVPMVLVFNGRDVFSSSENIGQAQPRSATELGAMADVIMQEVAQAHAEVIAAVVNRADADHLDAIRSAVAEQTGANIPVWVIPEHPLLLAPHMSQVMRAVNGKLIYGNPDALSGEVLDLVVAAMTPEHVLQRISDNAVVVLPSDRTDVLLTLLMADASSTFPQLAGIVLNGGFPIPAPIHELIIGLSPRVPVVETSGNSFDTSIKIMATRGQVSASDPDKVDRARRLVTENIDREALLKAITDFKPSVITPLLFEYQLTQRAKAANKTIVLPEGEDDRILQAAAEVLSKGIAKLIIFGERSDIDARAKALGVNLADAQIMGIETSEHFERCVAEYAKLRAHKGVNLEQAREIMKDSSYFGSMLVQLGVADGMVSGAVNTTAHTIKPSFEFIRTKPGVSVVSSVFLMALADRVLVYGDCAVIPEPTAEQLADIAISSADTARNFGIEPRVAMLSYSTGTSGSGVDVDKVRAATDLVRQRAPQLSVEGPIQYDAAVDAAVAKAKMPGSEVAGKATVFVFPDLNTGNNTYKAVQRTAGAVAIGPVLQGLNKPVNDLSRGALVADIVNTIAITAIQAGQQ
ncbi:MAG: phosphate acetyltransferase, partial [Micrococcales bacterium]